MFKIVVLYLGTPDIPVFSAKGVSVPSNDSLQSNIVSNKPQCDFNLSHWGFLFGNSKNRIKRSTRTKTMETLLKTN